MWEGEGGKGCESKVWEGGIESTHGYNNIN